MCYRNHGGEKISISDEGAAAIEAVWGVEKKRMKAEGRSSSLDSLV